MRWSAGICGFLWRGRADVTPTRSGAPRAGPSAAPGGLLARVEMGDQGQEPALEDVELVTRDEPKRVDAGVPVDPHLRHVVGDASAHPRVVQVDPAITQLPEPGALRFAQARRGVVFGL